MIYCCPDHERHLRNDRKYNTYACENLIFRWFSRFCAMTKPSVLRTTEIQLRLHALSSLKAIFGKLHL